METGFRFNTSAAFVVRPDTPLCECVKAMRDRGYGAVLVSDPLTKKPYGIFTERDVIRWIEQIQNGDFWFKPVFLLMSKPIETITLDEIADAPRIMIEKRIRHLPVVHTDPDSGETVMSMISMRDILKNYVRDEKRKEALSKSAPAPLKVGILSKSNGMRNLLRKICASQGNTLPLALDLDRPTSELIEELKKLDVLYFDIDKVERSTWTEILRGLNSHPEHPEVSILYDPTHHDENELQGLAKIGLSGRFSAYMKPLNFFVIQNRLDAASERLALS